MTKKVERALEALRRPAPAFEGVAEPVRNVIANLIEMQHETIEKLLQQEATLLKEVKELKEALFSSL